MRHWAEELARDYLLDKGYELLAENFTVPGAEVDLIMRDGGTIVFVEVRQRRGRSYGSAGESIDFSKLARIERAARIYLARHGGGEGRIDAVLVEGIRERNRLEHLLGIG